MDDFGPPDWSAPLDLEKRLVAAPPDYKVKGLFFMTAIEEARARGGKVPTEKKYSALSSYGVRECIEVLAQCAEIAYPGLPPRQGLRRLGQRVYPAFKETPAGTFMFALSAGRLFMAFKLVSRAATLLSDMEAEVDEVDEQTVVVTQRKAWAFPDAYHVGIFEGGVQGFGKTAEVAVRVHSLCDVDLRIRWS